MQVINNMTLIDFEGIENITKFKYRKTPPKYPKPGTFYWVEEMVYDSKDGETKPKWGLWYTTNDCELRRLDSKVYEIVIRDKDGYIRITDKDAFDKQEIYLIIGNFEKEVHVNEDGYKVFKVTSPGNIGLATVEATVEYVSDSNNMFYMSNAKDYWWVGKRLGDIREGDTKETLKDNTVSDILDTIIYPTLQPEVIQPSVKLSISEDDYNVIAITEDGKLGVIKVDDKEVDYIRYIIDTLKDAQKVTDIGWITCNRGHLTYPTAEVDQDGNQYTLYNYAGKHESIIRSANIMDVPYSNLDKVYEYNVSVWFEKGPEPLDNKRNRAKYNYDNILDKCDCGKEEGCEKCLIPQFMGGDVVSNTQSFSLVYPIYTNRKEIQFLTPETIDYNKEGGAEVIYEFPVERDGHSMDIPTKLCIDVPTHIKLMVYQFNELSGDYDVEVDLYSAKTIYKHGTQYIRYMRSRETGSKDYDDRTWYDTQTKPVKYKITFKK